MSERPRWLTGSARAGTAEETRTAATRRGGQPAEPPARPRAGRLAGRLRSRRRSSRREFGTSGRSRFARRTASVRRRPWALVATAAGVVLVLAALVWLVGISSVLATRSVTVSGLADPVEQQDVRTAAAVPIDVPLARVDTAGAAERVQRIPTIASVAVSRSWPSTVVISVQRKVPVLAVKNPQGQLQVVDASGVPFETVGALPPGVAQVNAVTQAPDPEGVRAAITVLELLSPAQRAAVSGVTVSSADRVTLQLGPVSVVWGGAEDGAKKLKVLEALLPTNPGVIDVSAPDTPITR